MRNSSVFPCNKKCTSLSELPKSKVAKLAFYLFYSIFSAQFWIGIKKYDYKLACAYSKGLSSNSTCGENVTYWTDSGSTSRRTSLFNLTTLFRGQSTCVRFAGPNFLDDQDCDEGLWFLCQKQCRMPGKVSLILLGNKIVFISARRCY